MTNNWAEWQGEVVDGEFRLDQYLGAGERSGVFATQCLGQKAVIKLRPGEARNEPGADLAHRHLLRILRTGQWQREGEALSYVVMEQADEVLSSFIPERSLEEEEARETLTPVLDAVGYLHNRGLVHGRIKPSNIMSVGEKLKISSDGLQRISEARGLTRGQYDAPEVGEGRLTPAADAWSIGVTLVEILTQRLPIWNGTGEAVLPLGMPEVFRDIANHCLRQDPQRRWTVSQISDRLAGRTPVEQMPSSTPAGLAAERSSEQREPKNTAVIAGVAAAVVVLAGAIFLRSRPAAETPAVPPPAADRQAPAPVAPVAPQNDKTVAPPNAKKTTQGRIRGKVEHQVEPDVSAKARGTIQGRVRVRVTVRVDASGKVVEAKLDTPRVSKYFASAALQAARRWRFVPPLEDGNTAASFWVLEFDFGRGGTQMHSRQLG